MYSHSNASQTNLSDDQVFAASRQPHGLGFDVESFQMDHEGELEFPQNSEAELD